MPKKGGARNPAHGVDTCSPLEKPLEKLESNVSKKTKPLEKLRSNVSKKTKPRKKLGSYASKKQASTKSLDQLSDQTDNYIGLTEHQTEYPT